nr:beta-galactosidase 3-like [Tanacetum cinerariifolium]
MHQTGVTHTPVATYHTRARYCKCEMPYNPDDLMVQCDGCSDWFHPACIDMNVDEAKRMEHFFCQSCLSDEPKITSHANSRHAVMKMTVSGLLDQVSVTRDASDYLWYTTSVVINPSELHRGSAPSLSVESEGHALHVYVNNQLIGSAFGGPESRKVGTKTSLTDMLPTNVNRLAWQTFSEDVSTVDSDSKMTVSGLLDQVSVTRDASDYLWYTTSVVINPSELHRGSAPSLSVESEGHALHVYVNNQLI